MTNRVQPLLHQEAARSHEAFHLNRGGRAEHHGSGGLVCHCMVLEAPACLAGQ